MTTFNTYKAGISFWNSGETKNEDVLKGALNMLSEYGFATGTDQRVLRDYPSIAKSHFEGNKGELSFKAEYYPAGGKIKFFATSEGEYGSNQYEKMNYLTKKAFYLTMEKIKQYFNELGFQDETKETNDEAFIIALEDREKTENLPYYNNQDRDKKILKDGEVKYFRDRKGRLMRGTVYHNINNMWWTVLHKKRYTNIASFEFFDYTEGEARKEIDEIKTKRYQLKSKEKHVKKDDGVVIRKSTVEKYHISKNYDYATFYIDEVNGTITVNSSYGDYGYSWGWNHGCETIKHFLVNIEKEYLLGKISKEIHEIDFEKTVENIKKDLIEKRRANDLGEDDAREYWNELEDFEETGDEELFYSRWWNLSGLSKLYDYDDMCDLIQHTRYYPRNAEAMVDKMFSELRAVLKQEISELKEKTLA